MMDDLLNQPFRPPAVPLVTHDPYFSGWSFTDQLTDDWARHWTGAQFSLFGVLRVDGQPYRFMGGAVRWPGMARQLSLEVGATRSLYTFECGPVRLAVTFTSPLLLDDLDLLARPVTYVSFDITAGDGAPHEVSLWMDISGEWAVNLPLQMVSWQRAASQRLDLLTIFSEEQNLLQKAGDDRRIDWGRLYLGTEKGAAHLAVVDAARARERFAAGKPVQGEDWDEQPRPANSWGGAVLAAQFDLGAVNSQTRRVHLLVGYDDDYSIEYFHQPLRAWWRRDEDMTMIKVLDQAEREFVPVVKRCAAFDHQLMADAGRVGSLAYARLVSLAYRQAVAAHKLVAAPDGRPLFFSKENNSNGCIATVDITYPSAPLFLLYNPVLLKGMMEPIFDYCGSDHWSFPFAAHDVGTYPLANGQVYGGNQLKNQMPVEECGNMLILAMAICVVEGTPDYARSHWELLTRWAEYLFDHGLDPENQLCTDDFAGHLAHNVNLSAKAIVALGCYSKMARMLGDGETAEKYWQTAAAFAGEWERMANDGDHYRLAFDQPGTWSQKYNLVWDTLLGLNLFDPQILRKEMKFYRQKINQYGLPLDSRKNYTKSDWILWCAALAETQEMFDALVNPVYRYAHETISRVPLSDWHDTNSGRFVQFKARSVVGGYFMRLLGERLRK